MTLKYSTAAAFHQRPPVAGSYKHPAARISGDSYAVSTVLGFPVERGEFATIDAIIGGKK